MRRDKSRFVELDLDWVRVIGVRILPARACSGGDSDSSGCTDHGACRVSVHEVPQVMSGAFVAPLAASCCSSRAQLSLRPISGSEQ